jgi:hypothetical protein
VKAIQDEVEQLAKDRVYVLVEKLPVVSKSTKAGKPGNMLTECKAFAKELKKGERSTLEWWKCYIDSYALYHTFFATHFKTGVSVGGKNMSGRCNSGVANTGTRGWAGILRVWLNKNGIANLISIHMLEADSCEVSTKTKGKRVIHTPAGEEIVFNRDTWCI